MHFPKTTLIWFAVVLSILTLGVSTPAQTGKGKFGVPTRLVLNGIGEPDPKEESRMALITESFYTLGGWRAGQLGD